MEGGLTVERCVSSWFPSRAVAQAALRIQIHKKGDNVLLVSFNCRVGYSKKLNLGSSSLLLIYTYGVLLIFSCRLIHAMNLEHVISPLTNFSLSFLASNWRDIHKSK